MDKLFTERLTPLELNKVMIKDTEIIFEDYKSKGVITSNCEFTDMSWHTTDEYQNIGLHFSINQDKYENGFETELGINYEDFVTYIKAFILTTFGKNALSTMRSVIWDIRRIILNGIESLYSDDLKMGTPSLTADFFSMLPPSQCAEDIVEALDVCSANMFTDRHNKQRALADFDSYFLFDKIMKKFWASNLSEDDRLFYYPLFLWWNITAVIPLRPREFILTERECLNVYEDGTYSLRLRRNKLKGGHSQKDYVIDSDYVTTTYKIPQWLGKELERYLSLTDGYYTDLDTLFVTEVHYKRWGHKKHENSRYLTYSNLRTILRYFYRDIIRRQEGLSVYYKYEPEHLREGDICYIQLGDTRHIALINIMQQGGTPTAAMFLAGHDNETMSTHYASNISSLTESRVYTKHERIVGGCVPDLPTIHHNYPDRTNYYELSDGSRCYSQHFLNKDYTDCYQAVGPDGEIGYCPRCTNHRGKGFGFFQDDDIYRRRIEDECKELENVVNLVRHERTGLEDICTTIMKLSVETESYAEYLKEKQRWQEEN